MEGTYHMVDHQALHICNSGRQLLSDESSHKEMRAAHADASLKLSSCFQAAQPIVSHLPVHKVPAPAAEALASMSPLKADSALPSSSLHIMASSIKEAG